MTSPLPPVVGSSPFPFPLPSFSPFPHNPPTNPNPSPLPFSIPSIPPSTGSNLFNWPSSSPAPLFPGMTTGHPFPTSTTPLAPLLHPHTTGLTPLIPLPLDASAHTASSHPLVASGEKGEYGDLTRGLESVSQGLDRCLSVLQEIRRLEEGLFGPTQFEGTEQGGQDRTEGMEVGLLGGLSKLELLHLEYTQLISSLIALSITTHLSSLPSPLSQALPSPPQSQSQSDPTSEPSNPAESSDNTQAPPQPSGPVTVDDITVWAEQRANLEFNRREAVRVSAKTVLDVLSKR
ncbi:hypothetical protein DB88DRAFT_501409 [Papiliotrema laurentii]|uniref:Uncharacterized protein n=1 Tax=Papiliotrema laurentii TaxID=5418 RepID=A0AAD9FN38_PAPLA|nr:hypothetical protein DB88DRAFT_501409 [Papiliotrema laurentii]